MGRLLALILGGLALVLYVPPFFFDEPQPLEATAAQKVERNDFDKFLVDILGAPFTTKLKAQGGGIFAGLALILFAVRGKN